MADLSTTYLGLKLKNPLVASSSPLSSSLSKLREMEDAGISAVVLSSLFEEQFDEEDKTIRDLRRSSTHSLNHSNSAEDSEFISTPDKYLEHIRKAKDSVAIPIIASLNGSTAGGWTHFAKLMEKAGADAIELNVYNVPTDANLTGRQIEEECAETLWEVRKSVKIPVALKISPYFSNLSNCAKKFDNMGANALVLFNRFYQPDFDLERREVKPHLVLTNSSDIRLALRWVALLHSNLKCDLAGSSGVHTATDALKFLMAGAKVSMVCSVLLKKGISVAKSLEMDMNDWLDKEGYSSVSEIIGLMSANSYHTNSDYERAQYRKTLHNTITDI